MEGVEPDLSDVALRTRPLPRPCILLFMAEDRGFKSSGSGISEKNMSSIRTDAVRAELIRRAKALGITGTPNLAAHALGPVETSAGAVPAHVVHAVDAIISDGTYVVLINRKNPPGAGKPALPGGFLDPCATGEAENAIAAAAREAMEEAGVRLSGGVMIGQRNFDRPQDVRIAWSDLPAYGIHEGELFLVSTQGVHFTVPDLTRTTLVAGDDAEPGSARRVALATLKREKMGIGDHYDMIKAAGLIS